MIAEIVIDLILIIKLIQFKKIDFKKIFTPQFIIVGILFLLSLGTQVLFHPTGAFLGNVYRLQGLLLFWHLLLFSILSRYIKIPQNHKFIYHLSFIFLFLGTIILGVRDGRAFGTLGEPNALAATALFMFPFVWFNSKSLFRPISLAATILIILLSGSRTGFIGFMLEALFILLTQLGRMSTLKSAFICFLIMGFSMFLPFLYTVDGFENRAEIWQTAFIAGLSSPAVGLGFGNIEAAIHTSGVSLNNHIRYQIVDSSHNFLLDFWIQGGLVGLFSILILIILSVHNLALSKRNLELTAFLGITTAMLFNPLSVVNLLAFWWLIGQGFTHQEQG